MGNISYRFKDTFAVIGRAGQGAANHPQEWILPLWDDANAHFSEIESLARKSEDGTPSIWGAMNDVTESNKRWDECTGKYMAGYETDLDALQPDGWTKWIIPAQTYLVAETTMAEYGDVFRAISNDGNFGIVATVHERYPQPENPNIVELWFPIADGRLLCQSCAMPMTRGESFGTEACGSPSLVYCSHCYSNGALHIGVTIDTLIADVQKLVDIETVHPGLINDPLLIRAIEWLGLDGDHAKIAEVPALYAELIDGQDSCLQGTRWEREWLADGKVCHCFACVAARKCISDIILMKESGR